MKFSPYISTRPPFALGNLFSVLPLVKEGALFSLRLKRARENTHTLEQR